ncbi:unnamed protein product [Urochloa decumbens]|uniref:Uncharacterized protein n=1 Tax=Urochloa decumbens TaxID=240449 RepID=A0ABC9AMB5_9POAL
MANPNGAMLRMAVPVAACIALVMLSSMGAPVMADVQEDCRVICRPKCSDFTSQVCNAISDIARPIVETLDFISRTCKVRVLGLCTGLCINVCSLNTLTPSAPTPAPSSAAAPPPCIA